MSLRLFVLKVPAVGTSVLLHVAAYGAVALVPRSIDVPEAAIPAQLVADVPPPAADNKPPAPAAKPEPPQSVRRVVKLPAQKPPTPMATPAPIETPAPIDTPAPIKTPAPIEAPAPIAAPMPKADDKPAVVARAEPPPPVTRGPEGAAAAPVSQAASSGPFAPADASATAATSETLPPRRAASGGAAASAPMIAALPPDSVTQAAVPRAGYQVRPTYPSSARRAGIQGTTLLGVLVGADGRVADVVVKQSAGDPDLDRAATDAVRRWRFEPARRGGEAVAMWVEQPVAFQLR